MSDSADAFVFFGATGDLAYQQVFPALQALTRRGHLEMPVVGVAKPEWTVDQLRARARESVTAHGGLDHDAFEKLASRLVYLLLLLRFRSPFTACLYRSRQRVLTVDTKKCCPAPVVIRIWFSRPVCVSTASVGSLSTVSSTRCSFCC